MFIPLKMVLIGIDPYPTSKQGGKTVADSFRLIFTQQGGWYTNQQLDGLNLQFWGSLKHTTKTGHEALQKAGFLQYPPVIKHGVLENLFSVHLYFQGISKKIKTPLFPGNFQGSSMGFQL